MKNISVKAETIERINNLIGKEIIVFFDGFGYIISIDGNFVTFYNTDELAESINGIDEAIILTSKENKKQSNANYTEIRKGIVKAIYNVTTILTFSKLKHISFRQRIVDLFIGLKSKISWKLYSTLFSKTQSSYSSYCINPDKYNLSGEILSNNLMCGFLIEFEDGKCFPLFSNQNSIFMMENKNTTTVEFVKEWDDNYKFNRENFS